MVRQAVCFSLILTLLGGSLSAQDLAQPSVRLKAEKKDKSADLPPDVIIVSGSGPLAEVIVRSSERIISHFRRGGGGSEKASVRGFNRGRKDFRRPAAA